MAVIADFESYPEWADVKSAKVLARDDDGRATEAEFDVSVPVLGDTHYTLEYEYEDDDRGISWTTKEISGSVKDIEGGYALEPLNGDTRVTYWLAVELGMRVPGFLKRQADKRITQTALHALKDRVERNRS
ncbi:MAG TPA: SRPBCC family protein, partial [Actinomycetota bacterium]|nr:SRPBCC family protein [Actinomycetota bacterium]